MTRALLHKPHSPNTDVPEEFEPTTLPIDPDEGPVPANIPDDPEHERVVDPVVYRALPTRCIRRQTKTAACP